MLFRLKFVCHLLAVGSSTYEFSEYPALPLIPRALQIYFEPQDCTGDYGSQR